MVRRCMEGSRRFGMIGIDPTVPNAACTEVEITACEPLPDGRFHLEVVGRRRCFVESQRDQDGYRLARVRYDAPPPEQRQRQAAQGRRAEGGEGAAEGAEGEGRPGEEADLERLATEVNDLASGWVVRARAPAPPRDYPRRRTPAGPHSLAQSAAVPPR